MYGVNWGSSALGRKKGEIPTRYTQEVKITQKFFWQNMKNQGTLSRDFVQHKTFITALTYPIQLSQPSFVCTHLMLHSMKRLLEEEKERKKDKRTGKIEVDRRIATSSWVPEMQQIENSKMKEVLKNNVLVSWWPFLNSWPFMCFPLRWNIQSLRYSEAGLETLKVMPNWFLTFCFYPFPTFVTFHVDLYPTIVFIAITFPTLIDRKTK